MKKDAPQNGNHPPALRGGNEEKIYIFYESKKAITSLISESFRKGELGKNQLGIWLVVSTHLKNISQMGNRPQIGVKIKNI